MAKRPDPILAFFNVLRGRQTGDRRRVRRGERELRELGIEVKFIGDAHRTRKERLWDVADVAQRLLLTRGDVRRLVREGRIPFLRLPTGDVRFEREAIEEWLAGLHCNEGQERNPKEHKGE